MEEKETTTVILSKKDVKALISSVEKDVLKFAKFLDNLYREYHDHLDRLGMAGTTKLAEVMVVHSDKVIEELKKY